MIEIELKLRGTPPRLKAAFARMQMRAVLNSAFKKKLSAVYFDTAKDDLHAKGLSFRIREEDGRFVQTLKQNNADREVLSRGEWSDGVASATPELLNTKSGRKLKHVWKDVRLVPRFRTSITRHGFLMRPRRGCLVEIVRDEGEIHAIGRDDARVAVSEIEIELKAGSPSALYDVALMLLELGPFQMETRAKSDRGYALHHHGAEVSAVKAEAPKIKGRETLADVLQAAARCHFGQFLANMQGALAHDSASIHQMRVSVRRLRSALYGVRDLLPEAEYEAVRVKLKHLLQSLGPARDWEVLAERISELEEDPSTEAVRDQVNTHRQRAVVRAVDTVGARKNTRILLEAMRWFEDLPRARHGRKLKARVRTAAPGILGELFDRVRRRSRHFDKLSVEDRHRLRIAGKNLRYNIELFASLYGSSKVDRFLGRLKPVQDDLGHLNDVSRARDLLGTLAKNSPQKSAADAVVTRLEQRVEDAEKRARKHVLSLRRVSAFWA